jgi:hypothetical protein
MASVNELTAFHPCDRCKQRSREAWWHETLDLILTFCGHHSHRYQVALAERGWSLFMVAKAFDDNRLQGEL